MRWSDKLGYENCFKSFKTKEGVYGHLLHDHKGEDIAWRLALFAAEFLSY